jgi:hypothetical protein
VGFQVIKNDVVGGTCRYCHKKIDGIWD